MSKSICGVRCGLRYGARKFLRHAPVAIVLTGVLASCTAMYNAEPTTAKNQSAAGTFLSPEKQRGALFDPKTGALIATDKAPRPGPAIRGTKVSGAAEPEQARKAVEFSFGGDDKVVPLDVNVLDGATTKVTTEGGTADGKPRHQMVSLKFDKDPLDFVLRQILGGILRQTYLLSANGQTPITFHTEHPIPVSELLPLLRGILGREGLVLRRINGIYHIGTPQVIDAIESTSSLGGNDQMVNTVLSVGQGTTKEIAPVVQALLPKGSAVVPVPSSNALVVRTDPGAVASIRKLVGSLFGPANGAGTAAIIPVHATTPQQVVDEVRSIYGGADAAGVRILPLDRQQAILVGARNRSQVRDIRTLVRQLDQDMRETPSTRVIPVKFLLAKDVADQLTTVLTGAKTKALPAPANDQPAYASETSRVLRSRDIRSAAGPTAGPADIAAIEANKKDGQTAPAADAASGPAPANTPAAPADGSGAAAPGTSLSPVPISIVPDVRNNALLVRSTYDKFLEVKQIVDSLDVPLPQVVLEGTILEVELNDNLKYGVEYYLQQKGITARISQQTTGVADPTGLGGVALLRLGDFTGLNLNILFAALQDVTNVQVISSPYLSVVDGEQAKLVVGDEIPYLTATQSSTDQGTVTVTNEVQTKQTGITVDVTPKIRADETVRMKISTAVSTAIANQTGDQLTPTISRRTLDSNVTVRSGQTVLLGGLIQNRREQGQGGVPVLRNIPIVGNLFGSKSSNVRRSELLILLTPRITRRNAEIEEISRLVQGQASIN